MDSQQFQQCADSMIALTAICLVYPAETHDKAETAPVVPAFMYEQSSDEKVKTITAHP